jgi:hypothetical protein
VFALLGVAALVGLHGCGDESVQPSELSMRELLALDPVRVAAFTGEELQTAREKLEDCLEQQASSNELPSKVEARLRDADGSQGPEWLIDYDVERAERGEDARLLASIDEDGQTLAPISLSAQELGLFEEADSNASSSYAGELELSREWGESPLPSLDERSESEALSALEPVLRRFLAASGVKRAMVTVRPAARAPLLMYYVAVEGSLWVNPNIVYWATAQARTEASGEGGGLRTQQQALTLDAVETCQTQITQECQACAREQPINTCTILITTATSIFDAPCLPLLEEPELPSLVCYFEQLSLHRECISEADLFDQCVLPALSMSTLDNARALAPWLDDQLCQMYLQNCSYIPPDEIDFLLFDPDECLDDTCEGASCGLSDDSCMTCDGEPGGQEQVSKGVLLFLVPLSMLCAGLRRPRAILPAPSSSTARRPRGVAAWMSAIRKRWLGGLR